MTASSTMASSMYVNGKRTLSSCAAPTTPPRKSRRLWKYAGRSHRMRGRVGRRPGDDDEALAMLVESTSNATPDLAQDVASRIQQHTRASCPRIVELLAAGTLPRTSSGKLRRREALNQWLTAS